MSKVSRSVDISAPAEAVFAYYARPEHIAKTFPEDVKMKVTPINVKEGFGIGTIFRIEGDFGGRGLAWDMETVAYDINKMIQVKAINGPFKKNVITVMFDKVTDGTSSASSSAAGSNSVATPMTKLTFEADYELGYSLIGKTIDKLRVKKEVEMGIERSCAAVKQYIEAGKKADQIPAPLQSKP